MGSLSRLIPDLQAALGPVILISGVGLLLLTITNRFGRIIDRSRALTRELPAAPEAGRGMILRQLAILRKRSRLVRGSIILATMNVLCVSLLMIVLFLSSVFGGSPTGVLVALFVIGLACLIGSLIAFLQDIHLSLTAVDLEVEQAMETGG